MKKRMFSALAALVLALTLLPAPCADAAKTYQCSPWAKEAVERAVALGILPDSLATANLTKPVTRAEFAAVSVNTYAHMSKKTVQPCNPNPFNDTDDVDVLRAYNAQLTDGTGDGAFSPKENLTREAGATMLARAYKHVIYPGYTLANDATFTLWYSRPAFFADDGAISDWAYTSVNFMSENDIINGLGDNRFGPKDTMTREQAIAIAVRMIDNLPYV